MESTNNLKTKIISTFGNKKVRMRVIIAAAIIFSLISFQVIYTVAININEKNNIENSKQFIDKLESVTKSVDMKEFNEIYFDGPYSLDDDFSSKQIFFNLNEESKCRIQVSYKNNTREKNIGSLILLPISKTFNDGMEATCYKLYGNILGKYYSSGLLDKSFKDVKNFSELFLSLDSEKPNYKAETTNYYFSETWRDKESEGILFDVTSHFISARINYPIYKLSYEYDIKEVKVPFKEVIEENIPTHTTGVLLGQDLKQEGIIGINEDCNIKVKLSDTIVFTFEKKNVLQEKKDSIIVKNYEEIIFDESMFPAMEYTAIFRNPYEYKGKYAQFEGKVVQSVGDGTYHLNVTKQGTYSVYYTDRMQFTNISERYIEGDVIKVYAQLNGVYSYSTVRGGSNEIPDAKSLKTELVGHEN